MGFSDGFTSATVPDLGGDSIESFTLLNNQASFVNITGLAFDSSSNKTVFIDYELERIGTLIKRQSGYIIATFNGTWFFSLGNYQGDSIIEDTILNNYSVVLRIDPITGQFEYQSGNMPGHTTSKFKVKIVRISV